MSCTVRQRERVREAAAEVRACGGVVDATPLQPGEGTHAGWSLSLVLDRPLSAAMMERLAAHGLDVPTVAPQGAHFEAVATT